MNILYISSKKRWGGVSSWMQTTALGLERLGHTVWILAHPDGKFASASTDGLRLVPKKLGMDYNPWMVWWIGRFIKKNRIDLLVTNIEKEIAIGGLAARLNGIPNVRRVGREDDFNQRLKVRWNHQWLVDHCVVPCDYVRDRALERAPWLNPGQFRTIYNGRNIVAVEPHKVAQLRASWGIAGDQLVVGATVQLSRQKRIDLLVKAFSQALERHSKLVLVITGEGPEKQALQRLVAELGLKRDVKFTGFTQNPQQVSAAYDIAVSTSCIEGFPNTVVEYFSVGRPVVSTMAGGVCEMAVNGHNALLIDIDDQSALADAIVSLSLNPALRSELGQHALETIAAGFSEDAMIQGVSDLFTSLKSPRGQP